MASLGRSLKPMSYLRGRGAGMRGRTLSSSSELSSTSADSRQEEQFILSGCNTPASEMPPAGASTSATSAPGAASASGRGGAIDSDRTPGSSNILHSSTGPARSSHSRPIAIELPARKISNAPDCTPPEPLSARGDRQGAYFPFHEDPKSRVHRPHPFYKDARKARHNSVALAVESSSPKVNHAITIGATAMSDSAQYPLFDAMPSAKSRSNTPVTSYIPSGVHETPLPMGKYYPSNWEKRHKKSGSQVPRAPRAFNLPSSIESDPQVPRYSGESSSHQGSDSDAKRRLQQYQRDMIAQASLAAREVLGGVAKGGSKAPASAAIPTAALDNIHLGGSLAAHRPTSPRLQPLGSPGPVTPMNLEGEGDGGYLSRGRPSTGPDAERELGEVVRALRVEEQRKRREGATSPAVDLGPGTF